MAKLKTFKIKLCRLCGSKKLEFIYSFGKIFVSNFVRKKDINKGIKAPLNLVYCKKCSLLQLQHSAPQEIIYKKFYWYRSGVTATMNKALKDIYRDVIKLNFLKNKDVVLDIGANDGTLLSNFKENFLTIGCEPARNLVTELKKNCHYLINDFWSSNLLVNLLKKENISRPKLITAIGMFYDLEDPSKFIKDAANVLHEEGVFIAQLMCLDSMLDQNDLGNICHEHLEFYSFKSLKYLFEKNGLKIFKIEKNNINGGSYRVYAKKNLNNSINFKENLSLKRIRSFIKIVEKNKKKCLEFLVNAKKNNKKVFVYGASTKGNTLLQYYGIDKQLIPYAAERSPEKWGKYTIGTGIKIISEKQARELKPHYFFVLPYGFINEFIERESDWLKEGGKFLIPYPNFKVINK
jgi:NDP-4-keto-2,6-dideoxyhexose 3-C-methyltransferase